MHTAISVFMATALVVVVAGCEAPTPPTAPVVTMDPAVASSETPDAPVPAPARGVERPIPTVFVRPPPKMEPSGGVDACAYLGWSGANCLRALLAEKDEVRRRYMRRLTDAGARLALEDLHHGQPGGVAHAEISVECVDVGPCKQTDANGLVLDDGYACLTKAEMALQEGDEAKAREAQARACRCDPKRAQIPVMGGILACDGRDRPVQRGTSLSLEEANDIRLCGECDHDHGPAACEREVTRLEATDRELAAYLRNQHAPRCAEP